MTDDIFLVREGDLMPMTRAPYEAERVLQELIGRFPGVLSGSAAPSGSWLLVDREVAVAYGDSAAGAGFLDHLFLDADGVPTLVEVKRSSDARIRREVVGQMLDYAANAAASWSSQKLQELFARRCSRDGVDPDELLSEHIDSERDPEEFWEEAAMNIRAGRMRLVFVADEIPGTLQRIIEFLNDRMSDVEVVAVEVKQYVGDGVATLVPRLVGETGATRTRRESRLRRQWDEQSFLADLEAKKGADDVATATALLDWARANATQVVWGQGNSSGSFVAAIDGPNGRSFPLAVYSYGRAEIQFQHLRVAPFDVAEGKLELLRRLNEIPGVELGADAITRRPALSLQQLRVDDGALQRFLAVLTWIGESVRPGQ